MEVFTELMMDAVGDYTRISFHSWWTTYHCLVEFSHPHDNVTFQSFDRQKADETVKRMKSMIEKYTFDDE